MNKSIKEMTLPVWLILLTCVFITHQSCTDSDSGQINKEIENDSKKILGVWILKSGTSLANKEDGSEITTATLKPASFSHEFKADGSYLGKNLIGNLPDAKGIWKLENIKNSHEEFTAILAIKTPDTEAMKGELFIEADGYQRFELGITNSASNCMNLITKKYEGYPYKQNWVEFTYCK